MNKELSSGNWDGDVQEELQEEPTPKCSFGQKLHKAMDFRLKMFILSVFL